MRAKLLMIFVAVVLIASACQVKREMLTFDNPSITIKDINVINSDKGKIICYTINLYSPSSLSEFVVTPKIAKENADFTYRFPNHTRRATVNYYLAVSDDISPDKVELTFKLNNSVEQKDMSYICSL